MDRNGRAQGLLYVGVGLSIVVAAVLLFGLTTSTGAIDVMSVITAGAGGVMVVAGLYQVFHHRRPHPSV
jgi:hypothetical protein